MSPCPVALPGFLTANAIFVPSGEMLGWRRCPVKSGDRASFSAKVRSPSWLTNRSASLSSFAAWPIPLTKTISLFSPGKTAIAAAGTANTAAVIARAQYPSCAPAHTPPSSEFAAARRLYTRAASGRAA